MYDTINIAGKTFEELMALFFCEVKNDDDYYDVIACNLAQQYRSQLENLLHVLTGTRLRAAICGLGIASIESDKIDNLLAPFLNHSDDLVISAAIDALRRAGKSNWSLIEPLLRHQSPYVRGAALRYCKAKLGAGAASWLLEGFKDPDPIVRENALDEIEDIVDKSMMSIIETMLVDSSASVREAARTLLSNIN